MWALPAPPPTAEPWLTHPRVYFKMTETHFHGQPGKARAIFIHCSQAGALKKTDSEGEHLSLKRRWGAVWLLKLQHAASRRTLINRKLKHWAPGCEMASLGQPLSGHQDVLSTDPAFCRFTTLRQMGRTASKQRSADQKNLTSLNIFNNSMTQEANFLLPPPNG